METQETKTTEELEKLFRDAARHYHDAGELEFAEDAPVNLCNGDNGAWVQCWRWIDGACIDRRECDDCGKRYVGKPYGCPNCDVFDHQD